VGGTGEGWFLAGLIGVLITAGWVNNVLKRSL
jgi:hypothetical protein